MSRSHALALSLVLALPLVAQDRPRRIFTYPPEWTVALPAYEKRVQALTAGIKRDAFIVGQITLALGDLADDFQKLSAMQKAFDRIGEAQLRAGQEPKATLQTLTALGKMSDALEQGRRQGQMANLEDLRVVLLREAGGIQRALFNSVREARGERVNLIDLQNRIQIMNAEMESAMIDALGSTFDFMASGGK